MRISRKQARDRFERSKVARLASVSRESRPHLVPVTYAIGHDPGSGGEVIVTAVDHKPKSTASLKRLRNITDNPNVALLADHYADDWSQLWWVRVDGRAELDEAASHPEFVDALAAKYTQYEHQRPSGTLIIVHVQRWSGWSAEQPDSAT